MLSAAQLILSKRRLIPSFMESEISSNNLSTALIGSEKKTHIKLRNFSFLMIMFTSIQIKDTSSYSTLFQRHHPYRNNDNHQVFQVHEDYCSSYQDDSYI